MNTDPRNLAPREAAIAAQLILSGPQEYWNMIHDLADAKVVPMDDGKMGSLRFLDPGAEMGIQIASLTFLDVDGVPVSVSSNVSSAGQLFELDVFKADFSPLIEFPVVRLPPFSGLFQ